MYLELIPCEYSKSGDSIRFTTNGFKQYWIKKAALNIEVEISEYEDWDNKYLVEFDESDLQSYGTNYLRINKVMTAYKL